MFHHVRLLPSRVPFDYSLMSQAMCCAAPSCVHNLVSLWTLCSLSAKCYLIACTLKQKEFRLLPSRLPSDYALTSQVMYCAAPSCVHNLVSLWTLCSLSAKRHLIACTFKQKEFRLLPSRLPSDYALTSQAIYCAAPSCVHSPVSLWTLCSLSAKCHSIVLSNNKNFFHSNH